MKKFSHSINIENNSNRLVSHTDSDWSAMRDGCLISIDDDNHFYTVGKLEELNFISDFNYDGNIVLNGDYSNLFLENDTITISYKEYEAFAIISVLNPGSSYREGDVLSCSGGNLSINVVNNVKYPTLIKVESVDGQGGISQISLLNKGLYVTPPDSDNSLSGGFGSSARISITYEVAKNRKMIDKQVINSVFNGGSTILSLNYQLPSGVKDGKISFNKYIAYLTSNYVGDTKKNVNYHVVRDRTPGLNLPMLLKNSNKNEEIFNFTIMQLDEKIVNLEKRIAQLEGKS